MRISKKTQYGLRAITYLAKFSDQKKPCCLKKISQNEGIPFSFLEKIIAVLVKKGLVKAKKGAGGGYFLVKRPEKIKVGQVVRVLEGMMAPVKCLDDEAEFFCPKEKKCLTKSVWKKIQEILNFTLDSITLADLIKGQK